MRILRDMDGNGVLRILKKDLVKFYKHLIGGKCGKYTISDLTDLNERLERFNLHIYNNETKTTTGIPITFTCIDDLIITRNTNIEQVYIPLVEMLLDTGELK